MNHSTYLLNAVTVTALNALYPGTPFTDEDGDGTFADPYLGCNRAASCAPGVGIATDVIDPSLEAWSILDQGNLFAADDPAARIAQASQHIGGDGLGAGEIGQAGASVINLILEQHGGTPDYNDTVSFIAAVVQAAVDAGYNTAAADPVNRDTRTIEIAERLWGSNTVA